VPPARLAGPPSRTGAARWRWPCSCGSSRKWWSAPALPPTHADRAGVTTRVMPAHAAAAVPCNAPEHRRPGPLCTHGRERTSGELKAMKMARASSTPGSVSMIIFCFTMAAATGWRRVASVSCHGGNARSKKRHRRRSLPRLEFAQCKSRPYLAATRSSMAAATSLCPAFPGVILWPRKCHHHSATRPRATVRSSTVDTLTLDDAAPSSSVPLACPICLRPFRGPLLCAACARSFPQRGPYTDLTLSSSGAGSFAERAPPQVRVLIAPGILAVAG
jgi:hypothetical protein